MIFANTSCYLPPCRHDKAAHGLHMEITGWGLYEMLNRENYSSSFQSSSCIIQTKQKTVIRVYCDFTEDYGLTQISHNSEEKIEVSHCDDPGCYSRPIIYDSSFDQIKALIELSESCSQLMRYDCFASPLVDEGINYGYWMDKNGETQIYWTGSNYGQHVCSCHFSEEGCAQEETLHNTCNCDSKGLSELSDVGTITNSSALPITELRFGGLLYDAQAGYHTLGKLICAGKKIEEPKARTYFPY